MWKKKEDGLIYPTEGMISRAESREALKFIKSRAKNIGIEKGFEEVWKMLPFYKIDRESFC